MSEVFKRDTGFETLKMIPVDKNCKGKKICSHASLLASNNLLRMTSISVFIISVFRVPVWIQMFPLYKDTWPIGLGAHTAPVWLHLS